MSTYTIGSGVILLLGGVILGWTLRAVATMVELQQLARMEHEAQHAIQKYRKALERIAGDG